MLLLLSVESSLFYDNFFFQNICLSSKATDFGANRFSTLKNRHNFVQFFHSP
jgi:hypothetical protein